MTLGAQIAAATPLSDTMVAVWGGVGALFALAVTLVLPLAIAGIQSKRPTNLALWKVPLGLVILIVVVGAGAIVASVFDPAEKSAALAYGMAWETLAGGVLKTAVAPLPKTEAEQSN